MPVRFRCDTCNGKLSIATRKIGTPVECPRCNESMIVPSASQIGEELTELLLTIGSNKRETAEVAREDAATRPAARNGSRSAKSLDDLPLFERSDFDKLLDPRVKAAQPLPLPVPVPPVPAAPADLDAIIISRAKATALAVIVVVLLGSAFGMGYLARGFAVPNDPAGSDR